MKSYGKLIYSPRTHLASSERWLVLMCDDELVRYYAHLYRKYYPCKPKLQRPVWGAHISLLRNEVISDPKQWGLFNNKIFYFDYDPGVLDNGTYFWLKVKCDALLDIREMYGLPREPQFGLHLTIGRKSE